MRFDRSATDFAGRHGIGLYMIQTHCWKMKIISTGTGPTGLLRGLIFAAASLSTSAALATLGWLSF